MSVQLESVERINALKNGIEAVMGESYEDLTAGVQALKNGYGQGSGEEIITGITDFSDFWAFGRRSEIFDKTDTSEGVCFDRAFSNNTAMTAVPKYLNAKKAVSAQEMFSGCIGLTALPPDFDMPICENYQNAFSNNNISDFSMLTFAKGKNYYGAFSRNVNQHAAITNISDIDMSDVESAESMFFGAKLARFPLRNTGNVPSFRLAFQEGRFTEAELDLTSCTDIRGGFKNCSLLVTLTLRNTQNITSSYWASCFAGCSALTNLSVDALNIVSNSLDFSACENLTVESLVNILNALSDNTGVSTTYKVTIGTANLNKLSMEQKLIALDKNIQLT
jgi:hypothetical protein